MNRVRVGIEVTDTVTVTGMVTATARVIVG